MKYNVLHNFISPISGRITCNTNYVPFGNRQNIAVPSPILLDMRLDILKLRADIDNIISFPADVGFVITVASPLIPNAQVLENIGVGITKLNVGGIFAIATQNVDYITLSYLESNYVSIINFPVYFASEFPSAFLAAYTPAITASLATYTTTVLTPAVSAGVATAIATSAAAINALQVNLTGVVTASGLLNTTVTTSFSPDPIFPGTGSATIPVGTTAQRSGTPTFGMIRANTDFYHYECRNINGIDWDPFITKIRGVSNQIAISGTPSEPSLGLVDDLYLFGTGYVKIPAGTTAQRGIDTYLGMMRLNTDSMNVEYYNNNGWSTMGSGNVTSVGINSSSSGLNITGSPITSSGTITLTLGSELQGLSGVSGTGLIVRSGGGPFLSRTITAGSGISVTNGNGVSGEPTIAVNNIPINTLSGYPSASNYFLRGDGSWSDTLTGNFSVNGMVTITGASGTITAFAYFKKEGSSAASGYWSLTGLSLALKCTTGSVAAVEFEATSSIKKKNILMNLNDSKEELRRKFDNINFVKYEWRDKQQEGFGEYYGYIAENIAEEFPELVNLEHMEYSPSILKFADIKNVELKIYDIFFKEDVDIPVLSKIKILIFINDKEEQREVLVLRKINFSTYRISTGEDIPVNHNIFVYGIYESVPLVSKTRFHDMTAARLKILIDEVSILSEKINTMENKFAEKPTF